MIWLECGEHACNKSKSIRLMRVNEVYSAAEKKVGQGLLILLMEALLLAHGQGLVPEQSLFNFGKLGYPTYTTWKCRY